MLKSLTRPNTFLLINFCNPSLVKVGCVVVVGASVVVSVAFRLVALVSLFVDCGAIKDAFVIVFWVAESGAILLLIMSLICLIADFVSLIIWKGMKFILYQFRTKDESFNKLYLKCEFCQSPKESWLLLLHLSDDSLRLFRDNIILDSIYIKILCIRIFG